MQNQNGLYSLTNVHQGYSHNRGAQWCTKRNRLICTIWNQFTPGFWQVAYWGDFDPSAHTVSHKLNRATLTIEVSCLVRKFETRSHTFLVSCQLGTFNKIHFLPIAWRRPSATEHSSRRWVCNSFSQWQSWQLEFWFVKWANLSLVGSPLIRNLIKFLLSLWIMEIISPPNFWPNSWSNPNLWLIFLALFSKSPWWRPFDDISSQHILLAPFSHFLAFLWFA